MTVAIFKVYNFHIIKGEYLQEIVLYLGVYVFEKFSFTTCLFEFGAVYAGAGSRELDLSVLIENTTLH